MSPTRPLRCRSGRRSIAEIVGLVHDGVDVDELTLVGVRRHRTAVDLACWPLPEDPLGASSPLVGWLAPGDFDAVALCSSGRFTADDDDPSAERARFTVLVGREGHASAALSVAGEPVACAEETSGLAVDVLARTLGLATPPPADGPISWLELRWLDELTARALPHPGELTWAEACRRHPFSNGEVVEPEVLAVATLEVEQHTTWADARAAWVGDGSTPERPPSGTSIDPAEWFDDGSFARWLVRDLPPLGSLLDALAANLDDDVFDALRAAVTGR